MSRLKIACFIVAPQAMRIIIPPAGAQFVSMLKDSSLISIMGLWELNFLAQSYGRSTYHYMEMLLTAAFIYWALSIVFEVFQHRLEIRFGGAPGATNSGNPTRDARLRLLDGGMGRLLERLGGPFRLPEWSALALIEAPDYVRRAHQAYVEAGADVITTNSYGLVPHMIGEERFRRQGRALASDAGKIARAVADAAPRRVRVAGSLPPLFGSYRPEAFLAGRAPRSSPNWSPESRRMSISG